MNTKKELQWWIEFGQKDFSRLKNKTLDKLEDELTKKIEAYTSFWSDPIPEKMKIVDYYDEEVGYQTNRRNLEEYRDAAAKMVARIIEIIKEGPRDESEDLTARDRLLPVVQMDYLCFFSEDKDCTFRSIAINHGQTDTHVQFFMSLLMDGTKREDYKFCPHCGNLFLQASMEKKYCTQYCSINASRSKK